MLRRRTSRRESVDHRINFAVTQIIERLESRVLLSFTMTPQDNWIEQGPAPLVGNDPTLSDTGAVQDIATTAALPNLAYIATTNGGIWKTTNLLDLNPTWSPQTDLSLGLSMGAIAISPIDPSGATVFAGLGAFSSAARQSGTLAGLMRTTDGGAHWRNFLGNKQSGPQFVFKDLSIPSVVPTTIDAAGNATTDLNTQVVLLAASDGDFDKTKPVTKENPDDGGIYRSTDGGATLTRVLQGSATDVIADPADPKRFYAVIRSNGPAGIGVYQSTDGGVNWQIKNVGMTAADLQKMFRIDLEASDASTHPIYAAIINETTVSKTDRHDVTAIYRLNNPTGQWTKINNVPNVNHGHQADIHFAMAPDPRNADTLYISGDSHEDSTDGDVQRGNTGTGTWQSVVLANAHDTSPHADSRSLNVIVDSVGHGYLVNGNDGGVYRFLINDAGPLMDPTLETWRGLNFGLGTAEIYSIAWDSINKRILSGNQDNGSTAQVSPNNGKDDDHDGTTDEDDERLVWLLPYGGDGFSQAYARELGGANWYAMQNNFHSFFRTHFDETTGNDDSRTRLALAAPGKPVTPIGPSAFGLPGIPANHLSGLTPQDKKPVDEGKAFEIPMVVNAVDPARLLLGHQGLYESEDRGDHISIVDRGLNASGNNKDEISALAYGGTGNAAVIYAGRGRTLSVSEAAASPGKPRVVKEYKVQVLKNGKVTNHADSIRDIAVDPADWKTVYVIDSSEIFKSIDAGKTWISLAQSPAPALFTTLQVIQVSAAPADRFIVLGTKFGVYFGRESGGSVPASFHQLGNSLPRAVVRDLVYVPGDDILLVATLGRGAWRLNSAQAAMIGGGPVVRIDGTNGADQIVVAASDDNTELFNVTVNGELQGTYDRRVPSVVQIFAGDGADTITLHADDGGPDYSNGGGSFLPSGIFTVDGGTSAGDTSNTLIIAGPGDTDSVSGGQANFTGRLGNLSVTFTSSNTQLTNNVTSGAIAKTGTGLMQLAHWSRGLGPAVDGKIAGVEDTFGKVLNGFNRRTEEATADEEEGNAGEESGVAEDAGTDFLQRIFAEGVGAFDLGEIGGPGDVQTLQQLRDKLAALDDDPSTNVTLMNDASGNPIFDFQVVKRLEGSADFGVELADGLVSIDGVATLAADVRLNLRFGVDADGFYIDPSHTAEPEITVSNIDGEINGEGRVGFLRVDVPDGEFKFDSDVKLTLDLHDPGTGAADGKVRLNELTGIDSSLVTVNLKGDAADGLNDDITFQGTTEISLFDFELPGLTLGLRWADAEKLDEVQIDPGPTLNSLLGMDANQFLNNILGVAQQVQQMTGVDIFAQKIPLLEKSVNDLLGGTVTEKFADAEITDISSVFNEDGFKKFQVVLNNIDASARGIVAEDAVKFTGADHAEYDGVVDSVGAGGFVVRYATSITTTPVEGADELVKVVRQASVRDQINAALGSIANPVGLSARIPTLQDLGDELGVDLENVKLSQAGDAIEMPFSFTLDPIHFSQTLDFGTTIAGLKLSTSGNIDVDITPTFAFTAGVRFSSGVPLDERIYIADNADPEVTLGLKLKLDDPTASGSIGFLDVNLSEDGNNDGINLNGALKLNLTDPGGDGRIVLSELTPANLLNSFDASADATFVVDPLKITASIGDSTNLGELKIRLDAADGHITSLADLTNLPSKFQITGASNFANFTNITPEMIVQAIQALIDKLRSIGGGGVLDTKLPVIDKSISELVDLGQELGTKLGLLDPNGVSTAQKLQSFLQSKLGNAVTVTVASDSIQFKLNFSKSLDQSLPFALNLGDSFGLLQVNGGGTVNFTGNADANLTFGVLTGANIPLTSRIYFDTDGADASNIAVSGSANLGYGAGAPFDASVKLGFLDFGITDARALIEANLLGAIKDPGNSSGEGAGRLTLQEIADNVVSGHYADVLDGNFTGRLQAVIPLDGADTGNDVDIPPGAGSTDALIEIAGKLENLKNGFEFSIDPGLHDNSSVPLSLAELDQAPFNSSNKILIFAHNLDNLIASAVLDFDNLLAGLDKLIEWGDKLLGIGLLDLKLPFTGASLRDAINFFKDPNGPIQTLVSAINVSGGLGGQSSDATSQMAADKIKQAIAAIPGVTPIGNLLEVQHDSGGHVTGATFKFKIESDFSLPLNLSDLDLGLDFFKFKSNATITASGKVELLLGLGIDKSTNGFYLVTDFPEVGPNAPEFSIKDLKLSVSGNSTVDVGFLNLSAAFDPLKDFVAANFGVDINGLDDQRLTLSELADFSNISAIVDGDPGTPELDGLKLNVEAKMDVPLSVASNPNLPSIGANFHLRWGPFTLNDIRNGTSAFTSPDVELQDLTLNPGEFIEKYALPFFQTLDQYNVLAPLIDKLDDPLPVIGGTLFDLLVTNNPALSQQQRDTATFLFNISKMIGDFGGVVNDTKTLSLDFGDVGIKPDRSIDTAHASTTGQANNPAPQPSQFPGDHLPFVGGLIHDMGALGITFPMLNLGSLMQLFMGNDTDLILAQPPELHLGKTFEEEIPIYSVGIPYIASADVKALFGGSIDLFVDLTAGLDSSGIKRGISHVLDGLYLGDFAPGDDHLIQPTDAERPEVLLEGSVFAGIKASVSVLGFDVASVTGTASIGGAVGLDLNDDNDTIPAPFDPRDQASRTDGKFYLPEMQTVVDSAGGDLFCLFDIDPVEIFAKLSFEVHIPGPNPDWSHKWILMKFDVKCEPAAPTPPDLADIVGNSLVLTSTTDTSHDAYHHFSATNHSDGDVIEITRIDKNGDHSDGKETLRVSKFGMTEDFGPGESGNNHVTDIDSLSLITDQGTGSGKFLLDGMGDGPDSVLVDAAIRIPVRFSGQEGNDTLTGGDGGGTLLGGIGDDNLSLGASPAGLTAAQRALRSARFEGGDGNDQISGGVGNDTALGGEGNDSIDGGGADADSGSDTEVGSGGNDVVDGRGQNDILVGDYDQTFDPRPGSPNEGSDLIYGGGGADLVWGDNRGASNSTDGPAPSAGQITSDFIFGDNGNDVAFGGADNDSINGGADLDTLRGNSGDDSMAGNAGDDLMIGGTGHDTMNGNEGNDKMIGDDTAAGASGNDSISGDVGDDTVVGDNGNIGSVTLIGGNGEDVIDGGAGNDLLYGQDGDDTMGGGDNNDTMFGNGGADSMEGDNNDDSMIGGTGNDTMLGNAGSDKMVGDDTVDGPAGDDSMDGGTGDDTMLGDNGIIGSVTLISGAGNDIMNGGPGADLMYGQGGNDTMGGGDDNDTMFGNEGADLMAGDDNDDDMIGGDGNDTMGGGAGVDFMLGDLGTITSTASLIPETTANLRTVVLLASPGAGNDVMSGDADADRMYGQVGNDTESGGAGMDSIEGNQGNDSISGDGDDDDLIGGSSIAGTPDGADNISGGDGNDVIAGDNGVIARVEEPAGFWKRYQPGIPSGTGLGLENNAVIRNVTLLDLDSIGGADVISGGNQDDTAFGQLGNDSINGDAGDDDLIGHLGADYINGGSGDDGILGDKGTIVGDLLDGSTARLIETNGHKAQAMIDVAGTKKRIVTLINSALDGNDVLLGGLGNDSVHGGGGADAISGDDPAVSATLGGNDALFGDGGADVIHGNAGGDHLFGGGENDVLDGDSGADTAYGGGGDDSLYADTKDDRLFDWFGNFNNFYVPGPGFGEPTIVRSPNPSIGQFLSDLAAGDGSTDAEGELQIVNPPSPENSGPGGRP